MKMMTIADSCNYFYNSHHAVSRIVALTPEGFCTNDPTPQQLVRAPMLPLQNSWDYIFRESGIYEVEAQYDPRTAEACKTCVRTYYRYESDLGYLTEISIKEVFDSVRRAPGCLVVDVFAPNDFEF